MPIIAGLTDNTYKKLPPSLVLKNNFVYSEKDGKLAAGRHKRADIRGRGPNNSVYDLCMRWSPIFLNGVYVGYENGSDSGGRCVFKCVMAGTVINSDELEDLTLNEITKYKSNIFHTEDDFKHALNIMNGD